MEQHAYSSKCAFSSLDDIKGKKVTVMGLGLNGGGLAAVRFFLNKGAFVTATDMKSESQLKPTVDALLSDKNLPLENLTLRLGEHCIEDFENADCVIKNPGVKYEGNKYLAAAPAIETDLSIFLRFTSCPIIAVTGSKGKSSTVSAIHYGLTQAGFKCFLGGNITVSPLTFIDEVTSSTPVVIEFSSWQLADLRGRGVLKPHIAIITKIVPDHQNWYGNMEDYVADKRLIYADQDKNDYSIFDFGKDEAGSGPAAGGTWGNLFANETKATVLRYAATKEETMMIGCANCAGKDDSCTASNFFGVWQERDSQGHFYGKVFLPNMNEPETILRSLSVPGSHMKTNVLNAALVMYLMNVPAKKIISILGSWQGISHRLQYFHSWKHGEKEFRFYNDSCATVPEAAAAATQAFGKPVILITGGTDKGLDFDPLLKVLANPDENQIKAREIYFLAGSATDKILPALNSAGIKYHGPFDSLESLLNQLKNDICGGNFINLLSQVLLPQTEFPSDATSEIVVMSPGATSFGMFNNEFDRGEQFMAMVKKLFS